MIKQEEQQILIEAPAILGIILMDHGEQHALTEVARLKEAAESAIARAETAERQIVANEARIAELTRLKDELAEDASKERQRAEAAEAKLAAVPVGQIRLVVWALDDGPYDEIAIDSVNRWLDERELEELRSRA